ncbi:hypothetical protein WEI85_13135 [Actinomycetes bacterium KLBMP 9797]
MTEPAWRRPHPGEHRWPVALAIAGAIALQWLTPQQLAFNPRWLLPAVEAALLVGLVAVNPYRIDRESTAVRIASVGLVAVATLALVWSTGRLVVVLVRGGDADRPGEVLLSGAVIWLTNVIVFALWYWLLDRGGPAARANARRVHPDFLFAQMTAPELTHEQWRPTFVDYLYLAFTNSTAFSPTDTLPLARWAKLAMMLQSCVSFLVVILVVARAVNALT